MLRKKSRFALATCLGAIATVASVAGTSANAQTAKVGTDTQAQATGAAASGGIGDIIVTARRRAERLQDVPVAATAFQREDIQRYATESLTQLATRTPMLSIGQSNGNGGTINLRGIQSPNSGNLIDQAVSINIDGVQISQSNVIRLGQFDLDRIEVLKGPQTLFFGKNSPGGVISIISANPTREFEGTVRSGYEIKNQLKFVEGTFSGPLNDTLGFRLDAYYGDQDGWFRNNAIPVGTITIPPALGGGTTTGVGTTTPTGPNRTNYFVRGTLAYTPPSGMFDANLKINYGQQEQENGTSAGNQAIQCRGSAPQYVLALGLPGPTSCSIGRDFNEPDLQPAMLALSPLFRKAGFDDSDQRLVSLTANYRPTDAITVTSVTGYYHYNEHYQGPFAFDNLVYINSAHKLEQEQWTEELRLLTSYHAPLNFLVGAFYQHMDNRARNAVAFDNPLTGAFTGGTKSGPILAANSLNVQETNAYSVFGQLIFDVTPKVQLTVGARYSHETKDLTGTSYPNSFTPTTFNVAFAPSPSRSFNNLSPDVTLIYKAFPTLTLYGAYRQGFVSGGFDVGPSTIGFGKSTISNTSYDQETVDGGEVGAKGSAFDRRVSFDLAIYHYEYQGLQLSAFNSQTLGFQLTNAGTAIVEGAELELQWRPPIFDDLTLRTTLAYNPAKYGEFHNAPCYTGQSQVAGCKFIAATGAVATPAQTANEQDLTGRDLTQAPELSANIGGTYEHLLENGLTFSSSLDAKYTDKYFADTTEEPASLQGSTWRFNASLALRGHGDRWEVDLIGTNLTNELNAVTSYVLVGTGGGTGKPTAFLGDEMGIVSLPRTVTVQAKVRF